MMRIERMRPDSANSLPATSVMMRSPSSQVPAIIGIQKISMTSIELVTSFLNFERSFFANAFERIGKRMPAYMKGIVMSISSTR